MFVYKRLKNDVVTERQFEQMAATIQQQQATIDYLAMMTDVDLPKDDDKEGMYDGN